MAITIPGFGITGLPLVSQALKRGINLGFEYGLEEFTEFESAPEIFSMREAM
jgi:hypothetical protein